VDAKQASPMFDARIALAFVAGPILAVTLYTYAQPLVLPTLVAAIIAQLVLPPSRPMSRRRMILVAGHLGFHLVGSVLLF